MTGWADVSLAELRGELDAFISDDGMGIEQGWYTVLELARHYDCCQGTARGLAQRMVAEGKAEVGQRSTRGSDGRRIKSTVYRLVASA